MKDLIWITAHDQRVTSVKGFGCSMRGIRCAFDGIDCGIPNGKEKQAACTAVGGGACTILITEDQLPAYLAMHLMGEA